MVSGPWDCWSPLGTNHWEPSACPSFEDQGTAAAEKELKRSGPGILHGGALCPTRGAIEQAGKMEGRLFPAILDTYLVPLSTF